MYIICRVYKNREEGFSPKFISMHKQWNKADYLMYDYFNQTLWKQIKAEGKKEHTLHMSFLSESIQFA